MRHLAPLVLVAALAGCGGHAHVRLTAIPRDALFDAPLIVRASGLHGSAMLTLTARDVYGHTWVTSSRYADGNSARLLAAMLPKGFHGDADRLGFAPPARENIHLSVSRGGRVLAATTVVRRFAARGVAVKAETLARVGFIGRFCVGRRRRGPAIVELGGSEGGQPGTFGCRLLASHGYPALALAYFGLPGLPRNLVGVPLEYFARALRWLARQPGVTPRKVVVMGTSRGGEAALLIASTFPKLAHGAIGLVPSAFVQAGLVGGLRPSVNKSAWTLHGKPLPFLGFQGGDDDAAAIRVERISGPVFVVGAGDDQLWLSAIYVDEIAQRMHEHGRHDVVALTYPLAGHAGVGPPNVRTATIVQTRYGTLYLGGTPAANARARADSWPKLLKFLSRL